MSPYPFVRDPTISIQARIFGIRSVYEGAMDEYDQHAKLHPPYPPPIIWDPFSGRYIPDLLTQLTGKDLSSDTKAKNGKLELLSAISKVEKTIDLRLLRPEWIPQLDRFVRCLFWPSADTRDFAEYPELTCLAMVGQLIVGAGLMNPDGYIAFLGIHPEWRGYGLGKHILAYLIDRAVKRLRVDPHLHCAIDNPAVVFYQQAGFRIDHLVKDHYYTVLQSIRLNSLQEDCEIEHFAGIKEGRILRTWPWLRGEALQFSQHAFMMRLLRVDYYHSIKVAALKSSNKVVL